MRNSERGQFKNTQYARDVLAYTFPKPIEVQDEIAATYKDQMKKFVEFKINYIQGENPFLNPVLIDRLLVLKVRELERLGYQEGTSRVRTAFPLLKY